MISRVEIAVRMELLSDAIFGSGFSTPGGEDIAVVCDERGYPYLPGTALKGLLRESMENLLVWTGAGSSNGNGSSGSSNGSGSVGGEAGSSGSPLEEILGEAEWTGTADGRRAAVTPLTLCSPPQSPEECFGFRTFTSLEDGIAESSSLRSAACVARGLCFQGTIACAEQDAGLILDALAGIKWAGASRSRGFGRVRCSGTVQEASQVREGNRTEIGSSRGFRYQLHTEAPVIITNLSKSGGNNYETRGCLPGSAVRGMVLSELAARNPEWFSSHRVELLSCGTQFLDAVPVSSKKGLPAIPAIRGFYEDKEEKAFESVVPTGSFTPGLKAAKLGSYCALDGDTVRYWSARTGGSTRIKRGAGEGKDSEPFLVRYLQPGQTLEGYIRTEDPALTAKIAEVFSGVVWLGADRYEGFGKCRVGEVEAAEEPDWVHAYGYRSQDQVGEILYLLAVSPVVMLDKLGEPCGLDMESLAEQLGVGSVTLEACETSLAEYGGYNRTWRCREAALPMYDRGSIFKLVCDAAPKLENIQAVQKSGLGVRTGEGFGQVLFLRNELFEGLKRKEAAAAGGSAGAGAGAGAEAGTGTGAGAGGNAGGMQQAAQRRRERYAWIEAHARAVTGGKLSKSQVGSIQSLCGKAMQTGSMDELMQYLDRNQNRRGVRHGSKFDGISRLIQDARDQVQREFPGVQGEELVQVQMQLLCQLFDYTRRGRDVK